MKINETELTQLIETVHRLRAPGGCPWDRAQTHQSLRQYLIEEAYEVLDVIDQVHTSDDLKNEKIRLSFREELGDLLMQVLLHSELTHEVGAFNIHDVAKALNDKLIRRHPHVFGETKASNADVALQNWEKEKAKEKLTQPDASVLDGVPKNLPALQRASRVIEKVTKVGFQWKDMEGPLAKLDEELQELKREVHKLENLTKESTPQQIEDARKEVGGELGDLFFSLCNVAFLLKISPEDTLRKTLGKFEKRFRHVERRLRIQNKTPEQSNLEEMDQYWDEAKEIEKIEVWGLTGGIGSGKSTVSKIFADFGIPVIDADQISRDLSAPGGLAYSAIVKRFGTGDRAQLRETVFHDPIAKKDLESILHPLIQMKSLEQIKKLGKSHRVVIYEAALLVETGRHKDFKGLIVVEAPLEKQKERLKQRDGLELDLMSKIISSQTTPETRRKEASFILDNSGNIDSLRQQVKDLIQSQHWLNQ